METNSSKIKLPKRGSSDDEQRRWFSQHIHVWRGDSSELQMFHLRWCVLHSSQSSCLHDQVICDDIQLDYLFKTFLSDFLFCTALFFWSISSNHVLLCKSSLCYHNNEKKNCYLDLCWFGVTIWVKRSVSVEINLPEPVEETGRPFRFVAEFPVEFCRVWCDIRYYNLDFTWNESFFLFNTAKFDRKIFEQLCNDTLLCKHVY